MVYGLISGTVAAKLVTGADIYAVGRPHLRFGPGDAPAPLSLMVPGRRGIPARLLSLDAARNTHTVGYLTNADIDFVHASTQDYVAAAASLSVRYDKLHSECESLRSAQSADGLKIVS